MFMKNERKGCTITFLKTAIAYYASLGVTVERVMTNNGSCYKSFAFRRACKRLGLKHIRAKPNAPKTNGKAERFIQTSLREWAYAQAYYFSQELGLMMAHRATRASEGSVCPLDPLRLRRVRRRIAITFTNRSIPGALMATASRQGASPRAQSTCRRPARS
jgi:transposase InsO family protein